MHVAYDPAHLAERSGERGAVLILLGALALACTEAADSASPASGGVSSASGGISTGGSASGGLPSGGVAPAGGASATSGGSTGGTVVASGGSTGGTSTASGGVPPASGGTSSAGASGSADAGAANPGSGGTSGSASGGSGGSGGNAVSSGEDRCDIANEDPGAAPEPLALTGNLGTHDPVLIAAHGRYYLFHTGRGVGAKTSDDLISWQGAPAVFSENPGWIADAVPEANDLWAPDISYFGGVYHLYYSASSFGENRSCIGHATRSALNEGSFADQGPVVCSNAPGSPDENWNAIDPNVIVDREGKAWLSFGSFWGGLKMIELDDGGARASDELYSIAARPQNGGALEAPFIVWRCGYYYLFVSFDTCCQGSNSTYKIMVGRATEVTGPYVDRDGTEMMQGGGTLLVQGEGRWRGPGHNAVLFTEDAAFNVYHSYDADDDGRAVLRISELVWDAEGWPISAGP